MIQSVYLIAQQGMDRVLVQTSPPTEYQRASASRIYRADIELPEIAAVDGLITVKSSELVGCAYDGILHNADPSCEHEVTTGSNGVECRKCRGWFCF